MKVLIKEAIVSDPRSCHHKKKRNLLIEDGVITNIGTQTPSAKQVIHIKESILSPGWFDMGTFIGEPGFEYKEDINSVTQAAMAGGFTALSTLPNTHPPVQSKNGVSFVLKDNSNRLLQMYPMASATTDNAGEELTEMIDLHQAGAVAFTDGLLPISRSDTLVRALQYIQSFGGLIINRPEDKLLSQSGQMNEGAVSTRLGLRGVPKVGEVLATIQNMELLAYAGGKIHLTGMSSAEAIHSIRVAKKKQLPVTCSVTAYQALLNDKMMENFDSNYKVNPPLRESSDQRAIIKGIKDNTIDIIYSGHVPQDVESKNKEFDKAECGIINLQTFINQIYLLSSSIDIHSLLPKFTIAPRLLLDIPLPVIEVGSTADLTLFDLHTRWTFSEAMNHSKAKNSPWLNARMQGKVEAVFNNGRYWQHG